MKMNILSLKRQISYALKSVRSTSIAFNPTALMEFVGRIRRINLDRVSDASILDEVQSIRANLDHFTTGTDELIRFFALAASVFKRRLGVGIFDEQLAAAVAMSRGGLAEMATGEGKTFAAAIVAALWALEGRGLHVLTANDYLAGRDAVWLQPFYAGLGLTVAPIHEGMPPDDRRHAYAQDITYLTAREAGYDYLRDRLVMRTADLVQRPLFSAIVDEADSLLIDEARMPLVIAEAAECSNFSLREFDKLAAALIPDRDYKAEPVRRSVTLTVGGEEKVSRQLGLQGLHCLEDQDDFARVHAAIYARNFLEKNCDYVVSGSEIRLVDNLTGRAAHGRRWPYGVQAAVETREGLSPKPESAVLGSIAVQRYIPLYTRLAAMSATAVPASGELLSVYGLTIHIIPPRLPLRRIDAPDRLFRSLAEKDAAILQEVKREHMSGRPILVITASVAESEALAGRLGAAGINARVLNARNDADEARAIAAAGTFGAVTVSTDMAGRGTDIRLGGQLGTEAERQRLIELGGLYVLATGRRENRRLDDQLRGRAGRQGEPGLSRFFTSLEDSLFQRYGVAEYLALRQWNPDSSVGFEYGKPLADKRTLSSIDRAQRLIEGHHHRIRDSRRLSTWMLEVQRRRTVSFRDEVLHGGTIPDSVLQEASIRTVGVVRPCQEACIAADVAEPMDAASTTETADLAEAKDAAQSAVLKAIDRIWAHHLSFAEDLREGIHLVAYGGRDPEAEFTKALYDGFESAFACVEKEAKAMLPSIIREGYASECTPGFSAKPSAMWTYQVDEEVAPPFKLAGAIKGIAAMIAVPLSWIQKLLNRTSSRISP